MSKGAILLISGPSGCGKSTLLKEVYNTIENYYFSISTTTREPRAGEKDGVDYFFTSKESFKKDVDSNNFLEWAEVHNNYYGTSLKPIKEALKAGKLVIFDIDVQGFEQVIKKFKDITTTVFITTPSLSELESRLYSRGTDSNEIITNRITNAKKEIQYISKYDFFIVNDDLETASKQLTSIAIASLSKSTVYDTADIISNWAK
ncbi:MAG: guanylate kinase [Campylobacterota bacterium]|nr:guanylate kinase [Campylobacterota bacterium]